MTLAGGSLSSKGTADIFMGLCHIVGTSGAVQMVFRCCCDGLNISNFKRLFTRNNMVTWNSMSIAKFNRSAPDADPLNLITAAPENHLDCPGSSHDTTQTHKGVSCAFWAERASFQSHFNKVLWWVFTWNKINIVFCLGKKKKEDKNNVASALKGCVRWR